MNAGLPWQLADSLGMRRFVGIGLDEDTPDHTTISRTRRLIVVDSHSDVFGCGAGVLADRGLGEGEADRDRCNDVGGERGDALDCAARHGGKL